MSGSQRLTGGTLLLLAAIFSSPSAVAFKRAASAYGKPLTFSPGVIEVEVASLPAGLDDERGRKLVGSAIATWGSAPCKVPIRASAKEEHRLEKMAENKAFSAKIVIRVVDPWVRPPTLAAWTEVTSHPDRGLIERVSIELNPQLPWDDADPVGADRLDLASVITHELGHALGLAHSYDRRALMRAGIKPGQRQRELTDDDQRGVCAVFAASTANVTKVVPADRPD